MIMKTTKQNLIAPINFISNEEFLKDYPIFTEENNGEIIEFMNEKYIRKIIGSENENN